MTRAPMMFTLAMAITACTASLDEAIKDAAPAFEKACQAVAIDGDD